MNPQDPTQSTPTTPTPTPIRNPLSVMQEGEQIICQIKRHPIGIIGVYALTGILLLVLLVMVIVAPHYVSPDKQNEVTSIGLGFYLFFAVICLIFVFIANKVYWGNHWILTSDSVTQITQNSLFDKQSSQLSLGNLEDVTVEQRGILPHMFNYGVLRVETAGERSKFLFPYCPNPNSCAKEVLNAREQFEQKRPSTDQPGLYRGQNSYAGANTQPGQQLPTQPTGEAYNPYAQPTPPPQQPTYYNPPAGGSGTPPQPQ